LLSAVSIVLGWLAASVRAPVMAAFFGERLMIGALIGMATSCDPHAALTAGLRRCRA
jgi:hypothetical protein